MPKTNLILSSIFLIARISLPTIVNFKPLPLLVDVLTLVALLYLTFKLWTFWKFSKQVNTLPGPAMSWNPLCHVNMVQNNSLQIGHSSSFNETLIGLGKLYEREHSFYRLWLAYIPYIVVYKADLAEKILQSTTNIKKSGEYFFFRPWIKDCLLISKGAKWAYRRKLLTPAFHSTILEQFLPVMIEHTIVLVRKIHHQTLHQQTEDKVDNVLDTRELILPLTFDIICETAMGVKLNSQDGEKSKYLEAREILVRSMMTRIFKPWVWNDLIYNLFSNGRIEREQVAIMENFIYSVIHSRRSAFLEEKKLSKTAENEPETPKRKRLAFLDLLLEHSINDPSRWTDADIEEEMEFFFAAGHETSTETVVWTLFCVGNDEHVQAKVHEELDAIWAQYELDDAQLTSEHLNQMTFLEACIKEAMRLYTPVVNIGRYTETDIEHEGYVIPKGSTICILLGKMHQDPNFFPQPERYIPERFLDKEAPFRQNRFSYIPFSAGLRNCIGGKMAMKELKVILAIILRHFTVQSLKKVGEIEIDPEIVSVPKEPVNIRYFPRF